MIELKKIYKTFDSKTYALENINLTIPDGSIYGIIGQSGAGKSTLIRCINMLERPTSGQVLVDKKDMTKLSEKDLRLKRKKIGMIFQHFNLLSNRTVFENIKFPLELSDFSKEEKETRINSMLKLVGLEEHKNKYPSQLSGGQKQRVGIARALINEPSILLSDEATSALDPETVDSILALLKNINKQLGITIVMITHQMEVIKKIADYVAVIEKGKIIEKGSIINIFLNPKTETLKKFIGSSNFKIPKDSDFYNICKTKKSHRDKTVVSLSFKGEITNNPIISHLIRFYNLDISILYGNIDYIQETPFGTLIVLIDGSELNINNAFKYIKNLSIESEVLGYVSTNNQLTF